MRIPRDWFGPKDDLVPFGPHAWPDDRESSAGEGSAAARKAKAPLDAEAFWGEDADSLHGVLDGDPRAGSARSARNGDRRMVVAGVLALLIAAAGLTVWVVKGSQRGVLHPKIASVKHTAHAEANRSAVKAAVTGRLARSATRSRPRIVRRRSPDRATRPTQVVYHPIQPAGASSPSPGPTTSVGASPERLSTASSGASAAAAPTSSSQPQSAFGASGALGPMSSPAG